MSESSNNDSKSSAEDLDADIRMLNAKRMVELRKRMTSAALEKSKAEQLSQMPKEPSDRELVMKSLVERGDEVLIAAEASYPNETRILISRLAALIRQGKISTIKGGELLQFLRSIGMRVSVSTSISVEQHGKFVSLAEKLKRESNE